MTTTEPDPAADANPSTAAETKQNILRLIRCHANARSAEVSADWRDDRSAFERHGATAKAAWEEIGEELDKLLAAAERIDPGPEEDYEPNLEGPGAVTAEQYRADRSEPGVLAACQDLHAVAMGSMDGMPADEMLRLETYLQRKLDNWKEYPPIGSAPGIYDGAVRLLIMTALTEWRACPWNPKNSAELVERGHDTAQVPAEVTEDTVHEDRAVCDRALREHMAGLAESDATDDPDPFEEARLEELATIPIADMSDEELGTLEAECLSIGGRRGGRLRAALFELRRHRFARPVVAAADAWRGDPCKGLGSHCEAVLADAVDAHRKGAATAWRTSPPTLAEVKAGAKWWWHRQRGEDGYTAPSAVQIGWDDDGLFFVEPGCPSVTPDEYGDGAEWHPCPPPDAAKPHTAPADHLRSVVRAAAYSVIHRGTMRAFDVSELADAVADRVVEQIGAPATKLTAEWRHSDDCARVSMLRPCTCKPATGGTP